MKKLLAICLFLASITAVHAQNISIPVVPNTSGSDSMRSGDDQCSNSIDSPVKMDIGVVAGIGDDLANYNRNQDSASVYARVIIPIDWFGGKRPNRIDCSRLYELQLREREMDLRERELRLNALENLPFEK